MYSFSGSQEVFSWLSGFINFERGLSAKAFRLDRMHILAELAGHPELSAPVIHIAGSKGKGSVTTMIASMLHEAGFKTGRYVSPHITEYRERVSLADRFFDESVYAEAGNELKELVNRAVLQYPALFSPDAPEGESPTFFELLTLYFFLCCRASRCDVMVVETGMGGRLDATNIVDPILSVITPIELEHTQYLGNTIEAIAGEKAGIIKPGRPVLVSEQREEAYRVFQSTAKTCSSPLWYIPELAKINQLKVSKGGTEFSININKRMPHSPLNDGSGKTAFFINLSLVGAIQAHNALQAYTAVRLTYPEINQEILLKGLKKTRIPARFERIREEPDIIIDGAHTPRSIKLCTETFVSLYGSGNILLFACAADKDAASMAQILLPHFNQIVLTTPGSFKKSDLEKTRKAFTDIQDSFNVDIECIPDTEEAIRRTFMLSKQQHKAVLAAGSFYLAAEVRTFKL
ncbi:folylpolyglutamate synthase/dihydrofolate synthase family protein [Gracilinema caldarium]|uniref:bifunctional folylpolyglutamate synthase/dihydrofolate synthase n=1 Tax=Gracilinema caldarium TaxID=215591 RepID=UPI0026ECEC1D|nr:folylpolyglutamate synthase/dihydrofolate synthase family protein [Gracilinema caldarium]